MSSSHSSSCTGSTVRSHVSSHPSLKSTQSKRGSAKSLITEGHTGRALRQSKREYVRSHDAFKKMLEMNDEDILTNSDEYLQDHLHPAFAHALDNCEQYICMLNGSLKATPADDTPAIDDFRRRISQATGVKQTMTKKYGDQVQRISDLNPDTSIKSLSRSGEKDEQLPAPDTEHSKHPKSRHESTPSVNGSKVMTLNPPSDRGLRKSDNYEKQSISGSSAMRKRNKRLEEIAIEEELAELERKKLLRKQEKLRILEEIASEHANTIIGSERDASSEGEPQSPTPSMHNNNVQDRRQTTTFRTNDIVPSVIEVNIGSNKRCVNGALSKPFTSVLDPNAYHFRPHRQNGDAAQHSFQATQENGVSNNNYCHDFQIPAPLMGNPVMPSYSAEAGTIEKLLHLKVMERRDTSSKFGGLPIQYISFRNEFNLLMRSFPNDPHYLFNELLASVTGKAYDAIEHCKDLLSDPTHALLTALSILKRDFGSDYQVRQAHLKSITDKTSKVHWDASSLRTLLSQLEKCKTLLQNSSHKVYLDSPDTIKAVVERLPNRSRNAFLRACNKVPDPANPGFNFLLKFIESELKQVNNPFAVLVSGNQSEVKNPQGKFKKNARASAANKESSKAPDPPQKNAPDQQNSSVTAANSDSAAGGNKKPPDKKGSDRKCPCCKNIGHRLQHCKTFINFSVDERWKCVKKIESIICPACFGDHKIPNCKSKYSCQHCGKKTHHSLLCNGRNAAKTGKVSASTVVNATDTPPPSSDIENNVERSAISTPALNQMTAALGPVYVRVLPLFAFSPSGSSVLIYALLDSGANSSLCTDRLVARLSLSRKPLQLCLEGVNGTKTRSASEVSFSVKGASGDSPQEVVSLKSVTSVPSLPTHAQSIPSKTITDRHSHLSDLQFPSVAASKIDLIIGADYEPLHQVLESRISPDSTLFAYRTPLGWVLAGTDDKAASSAAAMRCAVSSAAVCEFPSSYALPMDCYEGISDSVMSTVKDIMQNCVVTPEDENSAASIEDEKVLELFAAERYKTEDGHMVLPLPWRDRDVEVPDNRSMAESRLRSLRTMLLKNPSVAEFYVPKMEDTLKRYLKKVDPNAEDAYVSGAFLILPQNKSSKELLLTLLLVS